MIISSRYLSEVVWWHNVNVSARPELITLPPLVCLFIMMVRITNQNATDNDDDDDDLYIMVKCMHVCL